MENLNFLAAARRPSARRTSSRRWAWTRNRPWRRSGTARDDGPGLLDCIHSCLTCEFKHGFLQILDLEKTIRNIRIDYNRGVGQSKVPRFEGGRESA